MAAPVNAPHGKEYVGLAEIGRSIGVDISKDKDVVLSEREKEFLLTGVDMCMVILTNSSDFLHENKLEAGVLSLKYFVDASVNTITRREAIKALLLPYVVSKYTPEIKTCGKSECANKHKSSNPSESR